MVTATLLVGRETVLKDRHLSQIKKRLFKDSQSLDLNFHRYDASDDELTAILSSADTAPFLAEKRLIQVDQINALKTKDKNSLLSFLEKNLPYCEYVFCSDEKNAKTGFLKKLSGICKTHICEAPYKDAELRQWIMTEAGRLGREIRMDASNLLLKKVGRNLSALTQSLVTLDLYADKGKAIEASHVADLLGDVAERNIFDLYELLKAGRKDEGLRMLKKLWDEGARPHEISGSLVWQFERILKIKNGLATGKNSRQLSMGLGLPGFIAEKVVRMAAKLPVDSVKRDHDRLLSCDREIKRGLVRPDLALQRCLLSLD